MQRKEDWQTRLSVYLAESRAAEFRYGAHDCCLFVCGAVEAMTGADVAAPFRGQYRSRRTAYAAVAAYAGSASIAAVAEKVAAAHGMTEIPVRLAGRGDVVLLMRGRDFSLGLVGLDGRICAAAAHGFTNAPLSLATRAWRV